MTTVITKGVSVSLSPETHQPLRVEQALRLLPDLHDLVPLRGFVVSLSSNRGPETWAGGEPNRTIGKRTLDPGDLRARVPQVLARVTGHVAALYEAAVDALECERRGELSQAVRALIRAGQCEEQGSRFAQAHSWYQQALGIAEQLRDRQPEMEVLCHLGRLEAARGYLDEGARAFQRSLALAEAEGDEAHAASACQGLGEILYAQSQWVGSEAWYARGLRYAGDNRALVGVLQLGLGEATMRRGQLVAATEWLRCALETFEAINDNAGAVRTLLARGLVEAVEGRPADVLTTYREALGRLPVVGADAPLELLVRMRLAEHYLDLGRLPDAEDEARRAEEIAIVNQLQRQLVRVYVFFGKIRGRQGDENGFVFFEQAIELCRSGEPAVKLEADVYREYANFRITMGDRHEARAYLQRARDLLLQFGNEIALERIDQELRQLDVWVLTEGA